MRTRVGVDDESLTNPERSRLAYHLAGLTGECPHLSDQQWPGGPQDEQAVHQALEQGHAATLLSALEKLLKRHDGVGRDPRMLISLAALGFGGRALSKGLVKRSEFTNHPAMPLGLLTACWQN